MSTKVRASIAAIAVLSAGLGLPPSPAAASGGTPATDDVVSASVGTGGMAIDRAANTTRSPMVVVTVPGPTTSASTLRLSNDGAAWVEMPWATSFGWSLVDPSAGGVDEDGPKSVRVEGGPGDGTWTAIGQASILLDRTGPEMLSISTDSFDDRPIGRVDVGATDAWSGIVK